ncbi:MAG: PD-(D/E)XK nuclease family protein [Halieaceae bacterium]|nr:PD-(D/E)XK nuclease family protein [Halieaceae bacterium]
MADKPGSMDTTEQLRPLFADGERIASFLDEGRAVLTPNRRLARAVRDAEHERRREQGHAAWDSPVIQPLQQFFCDRWQRAVTAGDVPPRRMLNAFQQRLLWERVIEADRDGGFSLLSLRQAAVLCQRADEQLILWRVDPTAEPWRLWFHSAEDSRVFLRWRERVHAALAAAAMVTPEAAQAELLAALEAGMPAGQTDLPPLLLLHCDDLAPLHAALVGHAPRCAALGLPEHRTLPDRVRAFVDDDAEMAAAARWCRERVETHPRGRYAVVLQDMGADRARFETLLRREFDCLAANYDRLPVNFATGYPLGAMPIVRDALRILALAGDEADLEETLALLRSRFIAALPRVTERGETVARRLRELAAQRMPTRLLREGLDELLPPSRRPGPWDAMHVLASQGLRLRRPRYPSAWLEIYRCLLDAWQWGRWVALDSLEYQELQHWEAALDTFATLDDVLGKIDFDSSLTKLRRLLEDQPFQPQTTDRALQVLGPLETTGLSFDGLWIMGLDADSWPAAARPNPYLPLGMQRELRMPGCDAAWEQQATARRWSHWQSCTTSLEASYVIREDDVERRPSALLAGLPVERDDAGAPFDDRWLEQAGAPADTVILERLPVSREELGTIGRGSALVEDQIACPFRAFAARRLAVQPPPVPQAGLLASERGTLLHVALYELFERFPGRAALRAASEDMRDAAVRTAVERALRELRPGRRQLLGAGVVELERQRLHGLLLAWLELEAARDEDFIVTDREAQRDLHLGDLALALRIDRIDRLADGSLLLVDYKTGRAEGTSAWFGAPPTRPQMPLYALAEPAAEGVALACLRPGELGWRGVAQSAGPIGVAAVEGHKDIRDSSVDGGFAGLRERWREDILPVAEAFLAGDCSVDPLPDACRHCGRHSLCRIGEELA